MHESSFQPLLALSRRQAPQFCLLLSGFALLRDLGSDRVMPAGLSRAAVLNLELE